MTGNILKNLKTLFIISCSFFISTCVFQTISGRLLDAESNPIGYANIGIVGKDIGKVSNENGDFSVELNKFIRLNF